MYLNESNINSCFLNKLFIKIWGLAQIDASTNKIQDNKKKVALKCLLLKGFL